MRTATNAVSKPSFKLPAEVSERIDHAEKTALLSSAAYEYETSVREITAAFESEVSRLRERYLYRVISIHGGE
jgi:hypothetical protein